MSKTLFIIPVLMLFVASIGICSNVTTVIDQKNNRIELTTVHTQNIILSVDWVDYTIPIEEISTIVRSKDKDKLVLTTVRGKTLEGTNGPKSKIEGNWELGEYSIALSDIKSVDFGRGVQQEGKSTVPSHTDGFFAICTDRNGDVVHVYSFMHIFRYYHSARRTSIGDGVYMVYGSDRWRATARAFLPFKYEDVTVAIPFMQINTITFTDTNDMLQDYKLEDWRRPFSVTIELHDGDKLSGKTPALGGTYVYPNHPRRLFCGVTGVTQIKGFSIPFHKVQQITFNHAQDKNVADMIGATRWGYYINGGFRIKGSLDSPYSMSIKTQQGSKILLQNACLVQMDESGYWEEFETEFQIGIGNSSNIVDFDKISAVNFKETASGLSDQIVTTSGTTIDCMVNVKAGQVIGGNLGGDLEKLGPGFIYMGNVASLEISHIKKQ